MLYTTTNYGVYNWKTPHTFIHNYNNIFLIILLIVIHKYQYSINNIFYIELLKYIFTILATLCVKRFINSAAT